MVSFKKHWRKFCWGAVITTFLIAIKFFGLTLLGLLFGAIGYYPYQAHSDRYEKKALLEGSVEPTFKEVALPFTHKYDETVSLPFMASAVIDVNNDGLEEIFLGGGANQLDSLWEFRENQFQEISQEYNLGEPKAEPTLGAVVLDFDSNGWDDLLLSRNSGVWWYKNSSSGFEAKKIDLNLDPKENPISLAVGDINKDGYADLFVAQYVDRSYIAGQTVFNDPNYGGHSQLYLNRGDNTFENITESAGMNYVHNTFQSLFIDIDGDSDQDLVVVYDTGHIKTWRNNGNLTFTDVRNPTHEWFGYPMGLGVSDYDNDGDPDFFFSNIGSLGAMTPITKGDLRSDQNYHKDLILLQNEGDFKFTDVAKSALIADYEFSWGLVSEDFNNDGFQDLVVAQNYVDLPQHQWFPLPGRFLLQTENNTFTNRESEAGVENRHYGINPLVADFNQDGTLDLIYANLAGESKAFISRGKTDNFVRLKLSNTPKSLGAKVTLTLEEKPTQTQYFVGSEGLSGDSSHVLHFGVGSLLKPAQLKVEFLSGETKTLSNVVFNTSLSLR